MVVVFLVGNLTEIESAVVVAVERMISEDDIAGLKRGQRQRASFEVTPELFVDGYLLVRFEKALYLVVNLQELLEVVVVALVFGMWIGFLDGSSIETF